MTEITEGLNCPNCGGVIPIPEGFVIVCCPYCNLRSFVQGQRGIRRFQLPQKVQSAAAIQAMRQFLSKNWAIARGASRQAQVSEVFLAYLPFWAFWSKVMGWIFGQERVGSGDKAHYEPREVQVVDEMSWNTAACDVGEFGVNSVPLSTQTLEPFNPEALHSQGMVFEPVNSFSDARTAAQAEMEKRVRERSKLDRISQSFVRMFRQRFGLVYYPLWVLRYLYRGRSYQVVVDGYSGQVLYGKGPGNTIYRAAVLVGGMAVGAFLAVDVPALILSSSRNGDHVGGLALFLFALGLGIMFFAYRTFRYGEEFEYRSGKSILPQIPQASDMLSTVKDMEKWIDRFS